MPDGTITASMITTLQTRLEDGGSTKHHGDSEFYGLMTDAQLELASLLDNEYLTEFEEINALCSISSNYVSMATLNTYKGVLKGKAGINQVKWYKTAVLSYMADIIDYKDLKDYEGAYYVPTDEQPKCYAYKNRLYFLTATDGYSAADIWCLKPPTDISVSVDPIINKVLYPIFLKLVEGRAWGVEEKAARAASVLKEAYGMIETLNGRIQKGQ